MATEGFYRPGYASCSSATDPSEFLAFCSIALPVSTRSLAVSEAFGDAEQSVIVKSNAQQRAKQKAKRERGEGEGERVMFGNNMKVIITQGIPKACALLGSIPTGYLHL